MRIALHHEASVHHAVLTNRISSPLDDSPRVQDLLLSSQAPLRTHHPNNETNDTTRCNTTNLPSPHNPGILSGIPTPEAPMTTADQNERTKVTVVSDFI